MDRFPDSLRLRLRPSLMEFKSGFPQGPLLVNLTSIKSLYLLIDMKDHIENRAEQKENYLRKKLTKKERIIDEITVA